MAKAPELRHLIEFRFYAEAYDKWWTDEHTDFEAEQMRMVEEYSELNSLFFGFRRLLMTLSRFKDRSAGGCNSGDGCPH